MHPPSWLPWGLTPHCVEGSLEAGAAVGHEAGSRCCGCWMEEQKDERSLIHRRFFGATIPAPDDLHPDFMHWGKK